MIDIFSRYIVGVRVHPHDTPQVVDAYRGTSMTFKTVVQLLVDLEVTATAASVCTPARARHPKRFATTNSPKIINRPRPPGSTHHQTKTQPDFLAPDGLDHFDKLRYRISCAGVDKCLGGRQA